MTHRQFADALAAKSEPDTDDQGNLDTACPECGRKAGTQLCTDCLKDYGGEG